MAVSSRCLDHCFGEAAFVCPVHLAGFPEEGKLGKLMSVSVPHPR